MIIRPIHNEHDYRAALKRIESLMDAEADTPEGEELDVLVTLVEAYERKIYPLEEADPFAVLQFQLEQNGRRV